jgi:peptidoglycan hydrolase CwlO-like protein
MVTKEEKVRQLAYKIWEEEGRKTGLHNDHWLRAEKEHELTEQQAEEATKANEQIDEAFSEENRSTNAAADIRPPSVLSPD